MGFLDRLIDGLVGVHLDEESEAARSATQDVRRSRRDLHDEAVDRRHDRNEVRRRVQEAALSSDTRLQLWEQRVREGEARERAERQRGLEAARREREVEMRREAERERRREAARREVEKQARERKEMEMREMEQWEAEWRERQRREQRRDEEDEARSRRRRRRRGRG